MARTSRGASPETAAEPATVLRTLPGFERLPDQAIVRLTSLLERSDHPAGAVIAREGEAGDHLFIVVAGTAEVSSASGGEPVPLATLGPGEWFGEIALLNPEGLRTATVTALSPLGLCSLSGEAFRSVVATDAAALATWQGAAEMLLRRQFLKQASPFASLSPATALALAHRLKTRDVAAGALILNQGDSGDECYLIREGEVAVVTSAGTAREQERGRIGAGGLFGEMALLSDAPRMASVRAISDCRLLVLGRADFMQAVTADRQVARRVLELFHFRDRPRQTAGITAFPQTMADAEQIVVLKDPARRTYFRLSAEGWQLWQSLDGDLSVRDLIVRQFRATGRFAPQAVTDLLQRLAAGGFIETTRLTQVEAMLEPPGWLIALGRLTRLLTFEARLTGCDGWISRLYRGGVWLLFTPPALIAFAAIGLAGLAALVFALIEGRVVLIPPDSGGSLLWFVYAAIIGAIVLHEAGHAFTTKFFGREVDRIGVGWFWFGPVAYIDTSDMWTLGRWPRIAVDLAGLAVNVVCAAVAVFAALMIGRGAAAVILWQFVVSSWWMVLSNLNPLFEYDGFYALSDWLDRPNLKRRALAVVWRPGDWRSHGFELAYAIAGLAFVACTGALAVSTYRTLLKAWVAGLVGEIPASIGQWLIALAFVAIAVLQFAPAARDRPA